MPSRKACRYSKHYCPQVCTYHMNLVQKKFVYFSFVAICITVCSHAFIIATFHYIQVVAFMQLNIQN